VGYWDDVVAGVEDVGVAVVDAGGVTL